MNDKFTVHSAVTESVPVSARTGDGREVTAMVPGLVVELVPQGAHGSVTRRYVPADDAEMAQLLTKYAVGSEIAVTTEQIAAGAGYPADQRQRLQGSPHPVHQPDEETAAIALETAERPGGAAVSPVDQPFAARMEA